MSAITIRRALRRPSRRLAVLAAVLLLGGAVVAHHEMPTDMHVPAAVVCVAVLALGVAALLAAPTGPVTRPHRWRLEALSASVHKPGPARGSARAGPLFLVLSVIRR